MEINIPQRLHEKIKNDPISHANTLMVINNTEGLFIDRPEFFPDYTIHGKEHINTVLEYVNHLIPEETLSQLNAKNVGILISAVVLHDLGMFLSKTSVKKLLLGERQTYKTELLDKADWKTEWKAYIAKIKRYPEEQMLYHFGVSSLIEEPNLNAQFLSEIDYLIIGEFLRQHHHRIAHEIADMGMPGDKDVDVFTGTTFNEKDRTAIGLIARSHGITVRETERYVTKKLGRTSTPFGIPIYYLMTVLRIADALDVGKYRAPTPRQNLHGIEIPVSVKEWIWNQRIDETSCTWEPKHLRRYVYADPQSSSDFTQIEEWLKTVQAELDICWSIIAEKYDTHAFRLSIHRIDSNLFEDEVRADYERRFLTKKAALNANPELIKLMIAPLYGDDPSYGIRELLQNAVDACREREYLELERGHTDYKGRILVAIDTKTKTLTISDNGTGMNEQILLNYYLTAGASFRTSDTWKRDYTANNKSVISRIGQFGVGVLASFLLGDTIHVQTRYIDDELGYQFQLTLEPQPLDISRGHFEIGSSIKIHLPNSVFSTLLTSKEESMNTCRWNEWYIFRNPSVIYQIDGQQLFIRSLPAPQNSGESSDWYDFESTKTGHIWWSYMTDGFFYNGIRIPNCNLEMRPSFYGPRLPIPAISIIDPSNSLRMDLARNTVLEFPDAKNVIREQFKQFIASLLMEDFSSWSQAANMIGHCFIDLGTEMFDPDRIEYLYSASGYSLFYGDCLAAANVTRVLHVDFRTVHESQLLLKELHQICPKIPVVITGAIVDTNIGDLYQPLSHPDNHFLQLSNKSCVTRIWIHRRAFSDKILYSRRYIQNNSNDSPLIGQYSLVENCDTDSNTDNVFLLNELAQLHIPSIAEIIVHPLSNLNKSFFGNMLREYLGDDIWIPYDMNKRQEKFPKAFAELRYYIDLIRAKRKTCDMQSSQDSVPCSIN